MSLSRISNYFSPSTSSLPLTSSSTSTSFNHHTEKVSRGRMTMHIKTLNQLLAQPVIENGPLFNGYSIQQGDIWGRIVNEKSDFSQQTIEIDEDTSSIEFPLAIDPNLNPDSNPIRRNQYVKVHFAISRANMKYIFTPKQVDVIQDGNQLNALIAESQMHFLTLQHGSPYALSGKALYQAKANSNPQRLAITYSSEGEQPLNSKELIAHIIQTLGPTTMTGSVNLDQITASVNGSFDARTIDAALLQLEADGKIFKNSVNEYTYLS